MKQFKARIEAIPTPQKVESLHGMEIWFQAQDIIQAARYVHNIILPLGFDDCHVTKLIDTTDYLR